MGTKTLPMKVTMDAVFDVDFSLSPLVLRDVQIEDQLFGGLEFIEFSKEESEVPSKKRVEREDEPSQLAPVVDDVTKKSKKTATRQRKTDKMSSLEVEVAQLKKEGNALELEYHLLNRENYILKEQG